jgi:lipopolysaccharide export system permease protein
MKLNTIVNRYLIREFLPPFAINLVFFSFIFLMRQILEITNLIVNYEVSLLTFFRMLAYSMPYFLVYIIPMSVMMGVLLTFIRMAGDNEITALKAGGVGLYQLLPPVLVFGAVCAAVTAAMALYGMPWGAGNYRMLALEVAQSSFSVGLEEKQFNNSFEGVTFYVNHIRMQDRMLEDVFIEDQRKAGISSTIVAPRGYLFSGDEKYSFVLRLYRGTVNQVDLENRSAHTIRFDTYDLRLDLKTAVADMKKGRKDEKEMTYAQLREALRRSEPAGSRYYELLLELHRKFSIPAACLVLALLAVPLGVRSVSARKSAGLGIGLFAFLAYYLMLSAGMVLGEAGIYPPAIGMWAPNGVMGAAGVYLFAKAARDRPIRLVHWIRMLASRLVLLVRRQAG